MKSTPFLLLVFSLVFAIAQHSAGGEAWPQFRGPRGDGITTATNVPLTWSRSENIAWQTPIDGKGWSSPVLVGDKIWLTTADVKLATEEERLEKLKGAKPFQIKQSALADSVRLKAIEVDYASGKILRAIELFSVDDPDVVHTTNSYASPTPVVEANLLYCCFGNYGTCCVDTTTGQVLWRNEENALQYNVGPGSSPVLVGEHLILTCDGVDDQYITALDKQSGETVWKTPRPPHRVSDGDRQKAYSTPLVVEVEGRTQLIIPGAQWVCGYDPQSGTELWRVDHDSGFSNVPRPVFEKGVTYICTGFVRPELWAIRADGSGDVTDSHVLWKLDRQIPTKPSPILVDGLIYMVNDRGVATCVEANSGDIVWTERMGGNYSASPTLADGRIYFCNEEGITTVIKPGREYEVLAQNDLGEQIMASPIFLDGNIILRTADRLYRIAE